MIAWQEAICPVCGGKFKYQKGGFRPMTCTKCVKIKEERMDTFWCCFVEGTGGFNKRHETEDDAKAEAERLARQPQNRGKCVYILQPIYFCQAEYVPVRFYRLKDIYEYL